MKNYMLKPSMKDSLVLAALYLICGFALCFFKGSILVSIVRVIGIAAIVYGVWQMYIYFGLHQSTNMAPMIFGVPALILGLILTFWPNMLINFFPTIAGILLIFNSITQIQSSLVMKSRNASSWLIALVFALCMLALGIYLIIKPAAFINTIMMVTGIALIVEGIVLGVDAFMVR